MKICIVSSQILGDEKIGGFGSMTKQLALALHNSGHQVTVLIPSRNFELMESLQASVPFQLCFVRKKNILKLDFYRAINADIYHSQNQTILSSLVRLAEPQKIHIVTCRDPRNWKDWIIEFKNATWRRRLKIPYNYLIEESKLAYWAVQKADVVGVPARFLIPKVKKMYKLKAAPIFLPNMEVIPAQIPQKREKPTVLWVGRMAKRKQPEDFIRLAKHFPEVSFWMMGKAEEATRWQFLQDLASQFPNVRLLGFKDKFRDPDFFDYFNQSWILINTSSREGLPLTFIEATARGCAILSSSDPDYFASKFGFCAANRNFIAGLRYLLTESNWKWKGEAGHEYVMKHYQKEKALEQHLKIYQC